MNVMRAGDCGNFGGERFLAAAFALLVMVCAYSTAAFGQCTLGGTLSTWKDGNSNWNNASNWSPTGVPNSSSTNVCIANGTSTVTQDISPSIASLQLASGNKLTTNNGTVLTTFGSQILNSGQIVINGGNGSNTYLLLDNNATLSGSGTLTLSTMASAGGNAFIQQGVSGITLTNSSTIQGEGVIGNGGLTLSNSGIINANSTGGGLIGALIYTLTLNGGGNVTNTGLLEASNSGVLVIGNPVNNAGGNVTANGAAAAVAVAGTIQGGTLNTLAGGTLETSGTAGLDGVTHGALTLSTGSTYLGLLGTVTNIAGTINNQGNIVVHGGSGSNTYLQLTGNTTLQGGGKVTLSTASGGGNAFIQQGASGLTLTNVNNTIQGDGVIGSGGLTLINQAGGTINANSAGTPLITTLTLNGSGNVTNAGLLEATNSGVLQIANTVNNAGGRILSSGGTVQLFGTVQGGTLTNSGGILGTPAASTARLDGSTAAGAVTLNGTYTADFSSITNVLGTIANNGDIQLKGGNGSNTYLQLASSTTLQGGGTHTVTLSTTATNGGNTYIQQGAGGLTLTNTNTIQGEGVIGNGGLTVSNTGTINANSTGGTLINALTLNGTGNVTNRGLLEATNSGVLVIANVVNNAGGNITANGAAAAVAVAGTIQGGTLNTLAGGTLQTAGTAGLDGITHGALTLSTGSTYTGPLGSITNLAGTITNQGSFLMNGGNGTNTYWQLTGNTTLQGGGKVTLSTTAAGGGNTFIQQGAGGLTLTNVNNTIQGEGVIGNGGLTLINQAGGMINANSAGGGLITTLTLNGSGNVTNAGLLEATSSGMLAISNTVNNAGGKITAVGATATVAVAGGTIQGGTLSSSGGGALKTSGAAILDGKTRGALTLSSGSTYTGPLGSITNVVGTITNSGNFQVNGGSGNNTYLQLAGNTILNGTGKVTLSVIPSGGGSAFIQQGAGGLTLENFNNTVQGAGVIGNGGLTLLNDAGGTLLANAPGQALLINGSGSVTNKGSMTVTAGGTGTGTTTLQVTSPFTNFSGGTLTGGKYIVNGVSSPGILQINAFGTTGGEIVNNAASITLNGLNSSILDQNGLNALTKLAANSTSTSSFTINGGRNFTTAGNFANNGTLTVGASNSKFNVNGNLTNFNGTTKSLTGGTYNVTGTLQFNGANIVANAANITLTGTSSQIINQLSANGLAGFASNNAGASFTINGGRNFTTAGNFTNNGTLTVGASNSKFAVNGNLTNFNSTTKTLTGGTYNVTGTLQFNGANIVANAANITMTGTSSQIINRLSVNGLANFATNNAGASFAINGGRNFTTAGNFTNNGILTIGAANSTFVVNASLTNFNSTTSTLTGGTYNVTGTLRFNGANIRNNAANITLTGTSSKIINQTSGNGLANFTTNASTGNFTVAGGRVFTTSGAFTNNGALTITGSGSKFTTAGSASFTNNGTLTTAASASEVATGATGSFTNKGTLTVGSGTTFNTGGSLTNFNSTTNALTGGTYAITGTLQFPNANIVTNAANITLTGTSSRIINQSSANGLAKFASNTASGKFTVTGGQTLSDSAATLTNAGTFTVGKSSKFTLSSSTGKYTQTGGTTTVDGTLTTPGGITISGGSVFGNGGTFSGKTTLSGGTFNIGDALKQAGLETISKGYTQASLGILNIDIGGTTVGTKFDQLNISGAASLNGLLNLGLISGFVPVIGNTFKIMSFASETGAFSSCNCGINSSEHFSLIYNPTNVTLKVVSGVALLSNGLLARNSPSPSPVPEPGSLLLLGTGLVSLAGFARHRRPLKRRL